jgi:xanthine dehydrogenase small subunit
MRTPVSGLQMRKASSVEDALGILAEESRTPIAGATDLYVALNFGTLAPRRFLDIWSLDELRAISVSGEGNTLVIGALATYTALIESSLVQERLPMLVEASRLVGGVQIQNRGTVGGNIANGSPAGDSLPVFAAADAIVVLRSTSGERRVPFTGFYTGYRTTVMRTDELITAVEVPQLEGKQWFRKVGTRAAQAISKIVVAAVRAPVPRIAFGSVAPTVIRVPETEGALAAGSGIDEASLILAREIAPIDDLRSSAEYRRRVSVNLLRRFWAETG